VIRGYDYVQVAIPSGSEDGARAFYADLLGMAEVAKPAALAGRGGCWFRAGAAVLHLGVETPFVPARKAHIRHSSWTTSTGCRPGWSPPATTACAPTARSPGCAASTRSTRSATAWSSSKVDHGRRSVTPCAA
jgi:hypothetical protein